MPPYLQLLVLTFVSNGISSSVAKPIVDNKLNMNAEPDELLGEGPSGCNHDEVRAAIPMHSIASLNAI